ncbi:MAG: hypothetical protein U0929_08370 [Planctomycetaceae bacterium]
MSSESVHSPSPPARPSRVPSFLAWLGICVVSGLLLAPVFDAMPARVKFLGLHSWALAGCLGGICAWAAVRHGVRSLMLISGVSLVVSVGALLLLAHWGYTELKQATAQRMPMIPMPKAVGSPEEVARSLQVQKELEQALVPTFTDYQRRRMNSPALRRIRPLALWSVELLVAAIVSVVASRVTFQQMKKNSDFDSLPTSDANQP